jgi:hypothetical protein
MTKKEYILKLLDNIDSSIFTMADDIKALIQTDNISDGFIDMLIDMFKQAVHNTTDRLEQAKLQKGISFLTALKEQEHQSDINDQKDIDELESLLATI